MAEHSSGTDCQTKSYKDQCVPKCDPICGYLNLCIGAIFMQIFLQKKKTLPKFTEKSEVLKKNTWWVSKECYFFPTSMWQSLEATPGLVTAAVRVKHSEGCSRPSGRSGLGSSSWKSWGLSDCKEARGLQWTGQHLSERLGATLSQALAALLASCYTQISCQHQSIRICNLKL